jgi:hypothetical protein
MYVKIVANKVDATLALNRRIEFIRPIRLDYQILFRSSTSIYTIKILFNNEFG